MAETAARPGIWDLWLQADHRESLDPAARSILFRDLLRANGYVVPGDPRTAPVLAGLSVDPR